MVRKANAMHNSSSERLQLQSSKEAPRPVPPAITFEPCLVLLVEPHDSAPSLRVLLRPDKRYCFAHASSVAEIFGLPNNDTSVAVLSVSLGTRYYGLLHCR